MVLTVIVASQHTVKSTLYRDKFSVYHMYTEFYTEKYRILSMYTFSKSIIYAKYMRCETATVEQHA